jgi:GT2 family glycosyltransferase
VAPLVSLLILTHNRIKISSEYVPAIGILTGKIKHEILVWDNASEDGTFDWLCDYKNLNSNVSFIHSSEVNYGVEAINFLARKARGKYLIKIDDDILPPPDFAKRIVEAYEEVNEQKLAFLSWDMPWRTSSFALRSGKKLYSGERGKTYPLRSSETVYVSYHPDRWLVNGACRLCKKDVFLKVGGHPHGVKYGVDYMISKAAARHGYWIGYFHATDLIQHKGNVDSRKQRMFKDQELRRHGNPKHV